MSKITQTGITTSSGELLLPMGELNEWLNEHRNCRIIITFEAVPRGTSKAMTGYYYGYVVPAFRRGFANTGLHLTLAETERRIREISPVMIDEQFEGGKVQTRLRGLSELDPSEVQQFFLDISQYAAENLYIAIEDPRAI